MWTYSQRTGVLKRNNISAGRGYSGKGDGKNNPARQHEKAVGPIPLGKWKIIEVYDSKNVGPYALVLHSMDATSNDDRHDITNRSAFRIHGDSIKHPGTASKGCIILPRVIRELIWKSGDRDLTVIE